MSRRRVCRPLSCIPLSLDRGDPVSFGAPKGVTPEVAGTAGACSDGHTGHARLVDWAARALQYCRWPEASLRGRRSWLRAIELQPLLTERSCCHLPRRSIGQALMSRVALDFCFCCCGCCLSCFGSFFFFFKALGTELASLGDNSGLPWRGSRSALIPRLAVHSNRPELTPLGCQLRQV